MLKRLHAASKQLLQRRSAAQWHILLHDVLANFMAWTVYLFEYHFDLGEELEEIMPILDIHNPFWSILEFLYAAFKVSVEVIDQRPECDLNTMMVFVQILGYLIR